MKAIISVFIFSLCFSAVSARDESLSEAVRLYKQGSFAEAIPLFEKNSDLKGQSRINRIRLAECYLYRDDLVLPEKKDSIFRREELLQRIKDNYALAAFIFSSEITEIEKITPNEKLLGLWYYEWGLSEMMIQKREKAVGLFLKSAQIDPSISESTYYAAFLSLQLGREKDADRIWNRERKKK
ncbi:MAG TPA: hypothetical protein PKK94_01225 [Leptospiraceae bacterium]|nr:hypothetical protein [Leptospiraceae bacterium]HNO21572.1 hypothetical protein [Leptospiraceae bacterium]